MIDICNTQAAAYLEDVEIVDLNENTTSVTSMQKSMMIAEKQKILSRRQITDMRKIQIENKVSEPLTSHYKIKKLLANEGYTSKKVLEKFSQREGLRRSRFRKDGVAGLVEMYFQNDDVLKLMKRNCPNLEDCSKEPVDFMMRFSADGANISPFTSVCSLSGTAMALGSRVHSPIYNLDICKYIGNRSIFKNIKSLFII